MKKLIFILCMSVHFVAIAQSTTQPIIYPTHWWVGMKNNQLSLLIKKDEIGNAVTANANYSGVSVKKVHSFSNKKYIQVDLVIHPNAKPGVFSIQLKGNNGWSETIRYELKNRSNQNGKTRVLGVNASDFIYLLMPDRFSNGDTTNDVIASYRDKDNIRSDKYARHGGDIQGIINHLDYIKDLGATTIWSTPMIENDMPRMNEAGYSLAGFHGYWFTDHYKIDLRYGGNDAYKKLIESAHQKGIKIVHDAVYNHVGLHHWMNEDAPENDWINRWPDVTLPNHRDATLFDPNKAKTDNDLMLKGWFVPHLPDINLANPYVATFMIQNAIWLVEEFGFDAYRVDTYKYCDEQFLNNVNAALLKEFPTLTTFVEAWGHDVLANAYFVQNNLDIPFKHNAMGALDFPLCFAMHNALTQKTEWTTGLNELYLTLAKDFVYKNPLNNVIFLDNHDLHRFYSVVGENLAKFKMGFSLLLTMRGIPQMYYGDEILMKNFKIPTDQEIRFDFPGGWREDTINKFTPEGRTALENEVFNHIKTLAHFRKKSAAITQGKTTQYIPKNGVYVYFRFTNSQTVMCVLNTNESAVKIEADNYMERTKGFYKFTNILDCKTYGRYFEVPPQTMYVLELN